MYYLQSRYYDPAIGRYINADVYLSTGQGIIGYNMFVYCNNNPIAGADPYGRFDIGGFVTGLLIVAATVVTAAVVGITSPIGAIVAGAAIATGVITSYAAATDSTMVVDLSVATPSTNSPYGKVGVSAVIDFEDDEINLYGHAGGGIGSGGGMAYSVGLVDNYDEPEDYAKHFFDINTGYTMGIDHCWNPLENHNSATQATAITFASPASFISYGVGYDYYFNPFPILKW